MAIVLYNAPTEMVAGGSFDMGTGSNRILIAFVYNQSSTAPTITINGSNMTNVNSPPELFTNAGGRWATLMYLVNPSSGTQTIPAVSGADQVWYSVYTGVNTSVPINTSAGIGLQSSTASENLTSTVDNCWALGGGSATQNVTVVSGAFTIGYTGSTYRFYSSNGSVGVAGTYTVGTSFTGGGGGIGGFNAIMLAPFVASINNSGFFSAAI